MIAAAVFVACWGGTIFWWRTSARVPATPEWMLLLFGLPMTLLLAGFIGHKWIAQRSAVQADTPPQQAAPATTAASPAHAQPLAILATALRAPQGASPEELAAAIANDKARPDLDRELVDDDGFPVMCARCEDARDNALREDVTDWLAAHGGIEPNFSDEQWRALTLASSVVAELAGRASIEWSVRDDAAPRLQVSPLLPADWSEGQRDAAAAWLRHTAAQAGWRGEIGAAACEAGRGDPVAGIAAAAAAPGVTLVVAAASHVGEATVARWASEQILFTAAQPQGMMPGEGAAGLLLGGAALAGASDGQAAALLAPLAEVQVAAPAGARRRGPDRVLAGLVERTLVDAGGNAGDVAMIVADTGHRSRPVVELMEYAATTMRQLDGSEDVVHVGTGSGACGVVTFVTALALGAHYAGVRQAPVLCLASEVPGRRIATVVRPVG
ncbi:hypothetical protein NX786_26080 [Telluria mixta]|uniref:Beta-ketoacyl synthase N-terminal domain-containing protein n=1 Tax=Telluria mixta TaxID=34071 RepID=A0ABT2C7P4_9BURK|nr:hypothetical protein [Telluria mixta]MCS0632806.1 hypothetical protein [Telluria mixta]WEM97882.1 hypothetical protein P0M04_09230 [Telluria mixta]